MAALPDESEIEAYRAAKNLGDMSRTNVIRMMLAAEHVAAARERLDAEPPLIDADYLCAGLRALQDAAHDAGLLPEVLAAAVPAVAQRLVTQSLTKKDTTR